MGRRPQGRELYDHEQDAKELKNLADADAQAKTVESLSKQLHASIAASFPPSGHRPPIREGAMWQPTLTMAITHTTGDWPGTIAAMVVRSLRSKMCLSPSRRPTIQPLSSQRAITCNAMFSF